jgi:hypothetical protein
MLCATIEVAKVIIRPIIGDLEEGKWARDHNRRKKEIQTERLQTWQLRPNNRINMLLHHQI